MTFNEARNILAIMFYGTEEGKEINKILNKVDENPWHTGTPTEEGNYIAHLRIKSRDGEFIEYDMTCNLEVLLNYIRCQDESEENYLMVKGWLRYEPYKED